MGTILQRIFALTKKELLALLRDAASRAVLIGPPIIQLVVFGYAATFDLRNIPFVVYDQDAGVYSRDLIARFTGSPNFHLLRAVHSQKELASVIDDESALLAINIGPDFTRRLERGQPAHVQIILNGRDSNTAATASGYAQVIVRSFNQAWITGHGADPAPTVLTERAWFNPNLESRWFFVPGICGILMLLVSMLTTGLSVAREREMGTFDQLLVTPMRPAEILLGKALPGFIVGVFEGSLVVLVSVFWFGVPFTGSILALYFGMFCFLLATVGIGLMISSLAVTQQQGLLGVFLFMVPSIVLSGFATPIANMPVAVQYITLLNPLRYFLIVLRGCFLEGATGSLLWPQYLPLILIGFASMTAATQLFRRGLN
jgi:ABC-2 type transport system permease protein